MQKLSDQDPTPADEDPKLADSDQMPDHQELCPSDADVTPAVQEPVPADQEPVPADQSSTDSPSYEKRTVEESQPGNVDAVDTLHTLAADLSTVDTTPGVDVDNQPSPEAVQTSPVV